MKSSAPTAIALTLLMFLLVLAAAVFFLFQRQQGLKGELQTAKEDARSFVQQQSEFELNNSAVQATLNSVRASGTSTAADNVDLTEQLANSDQLKATLESKEVLLTTDLGNANATTESYKALAPSVTVVEPQADTEVTVGQPVELVIVSTDLLGVDSILINIDGEDLPGDPVESNGKTAIKRHSWTPVDERPITISITATNVEGITSEPHLITLAALAAPTNTPEPTIEPTLEPTAEN